MKAATKAQKEHFAALAELGCIVCARPAEIHHCGTYMGGGRDHDKVIPLCPSHHRVYDPIIISVHGSRKAFEKVYGTEEHLMNKAKKILKIKQAGEMAVVGCRRTEIPHIGVVQKCQPK